MHSCEDQLQQNMNWQTNWDVDTTIVMSEEHWTWLRKVCIFCGEGERRGISAMFPMHGIEAINQQKHRGSYEDYLEFQKVLVHHMIYNSLHLVCIEDTGSHQMYPWLSMQTWISIMIAELSCSNLKDWSHENFLPLTLFKLTIVISIIFYQFWFIYHHLRRL